MSDYVRQAVKELLKEGTLALDAKEPELGLYCHCNSDLRGGGLNHFDSMYVNWNLAEQVLLQVYARIPGDHAVLSLRAEIDPLTRESQGTPEWVIGTLLTMIEARDWLGQRKYDFRAERTSLMQLLHTEECSLRINGQFPVTLKYEGKLPLNTSGDLISLVRTANDCARYVRTEGCIALDESNLYAGRRPTLALSLREPLHKNFGKWRLNQKRRMR